MLTHLLLGWVLDDATLFQNKWKRRYDDDDDDDGDNAELDRDISVEPRTAARTATDRSMLTVFQPHDSLRVHRER